MQKSNSGAGTRDGQKEATMKNQLGKSFVKLLALAAGTFLLVADQICQQLSL
jgi:hypothetical protein